MAGTKLHLLSGLDRAMAGTKLHLLSFVVAVTLCQVVLANLCLQPITFCLNGSTCYNNLTSGFIQCHCLCGYTGGYCGIKLPNTTVCTTPAGAVSTTTPFFNQTFSEEVPCSNLTGFTKFHEEGTYCFRNRSARCKPGWGSQGTSCRIRCDVPCQGGTCMVLKNSTGQFNPMCTCGPTTTNVDGVCTDRCIVDPSRPECEKAPTALYAGMGAAISVALLLAVAFCVMTYFLWRRRVLWASKLIYRILPFEDDDNLRFDAFLSFKSDGPGDAFVLRQLYPKLEKEWGYNCVFHHRDFIPGCTIMENILNAVEESRRVILLITRDFLGSGWCQMEIHAAQERMLQRKTRILPLVIEDVMDHPDLDKNLKYLLKTVTYIEMPKSADPECKEWKEFWDRIYYSMPKKRRNGEEGNTSPDTSIWGRVKRFLRVTPKSGSADRVEAGVAVAEPALNRNGHQNIALELDEDPVAVRTQVIPDRSTEALPVAVAIDETSSKPGKKLATMELVTNSTPSRDQTSSQAVVGDTSRAVDIGDTNQETVIGDTAGKNVIGDTVVKEAEQNVPADNSPSENDNHDESVDQVGDLPSPFALHGHVSPYKRLTSESSDEIMLGPSRQVSTDTCNSETALITDTSHL